MIPDQPDEEPLDDFELLMSELTNEQLVLLNARGLGPQDVLDGKVPGLDPEEILGRAHARAREIAGEPADD